MRFLKPSFREIKSTGVDLLASKIAGTILGLQRITAVWLNDRVQRLPAVILKVMILVICLMFSYCCLLLLIRGEM